MSESKWIASREAGELMHAAAYRIVADDEDETWVCWADTAEFAAQIAHEHNTHAALVEACKRAKAFGHHDTCQHVVAGAEFPCACGYALAKAALEAVEGATSEQR